MSIQDSIQDRTARLLLLLHLWDQRDTAQDAHVSKKAAWDALGVIQQLEATLSTLSIDLTIGLQKFLNRRAREAQEADSDTVQLPPPPE